MYFEKQTQLKQNVYFNTCLSSHVNKAIWHFKAVYK